MAKRGEIGPDGLMPSERRRRAQMRREASRREARQAVRNKDPNPASRVYDGDRIAADRPEDILFNKACRAFEIKQWQG